MLVFLFLSALLGTQATPTEFAANQGLTDRSVASIPEIRVNPVRTEAFDVLELPIVLSPGAPWLSEPFAVGTFNRAWVRFEVGSGFVPVRCTLFESMLGDDDYVRDLAFDPPSHEIEGWSPFIDLGPITGRFARIECENRIQTTPADLRRVRVLLRR